MAPELFEEEPYSEKFDIYSFALVLYEIVVGRPVFARSLSLPQLSRKLIRGDRADIPGTVRKWARNLTQKAWAIDPTERPSFDEINQTLRRNGACLAHEEFDVEALGTYLQWVRASEPQYEDNDKTTKQKTIPKNPRKQNERKYN